MLSGKCDYLWCVKIINPENKGGFIVEDWKDQKFYTKESLEENISLQFSKYSSDTDFQFGYLCPQAYLRVQPSIAATLAPQPSIAVTSQSQVSLLAVTQCQ